MIFFADLRPFFLRGSHENRCHCPRDGRTPVTDLASLLSPPDLKERIRCIRLIVFDFDGVMTDNAVYIFEDGREAVRCSRGDGMGITLLRKQGFAMTVLSTEENPVVSARCRKLKLPCIQGCADKPTAFRQMLAERGLQPAEAAFMGNDVNDFGCLTLAGLAIVPGDAHPAVLPLAHWRTANKGGQGAVREVCDLFLEVLAS